MYLCINFCFNTGNPQFKFLQSMVEAIRCNAFTMISLYDLLRAVSNAIIKMYKSACVFLCVFAILFSRLIECYYTLITFISSFYY